MSISSLSSTALYAKIKASGVKMLTAENYRDLAGINDLSEFSMYLKGKTAYSEAFEGIGSAVRLSRQHLEGVFMRLVFLRLEKTVKYAELCHNFFKEYILAKHACECIIRRLRQKGNFTPDSYFLYMPEGFFEKTTFDFYSLDKASSLSEIEVVLSDTVYGKLLQSVFDYSKRGEYSGLIVPENILYEHLYSFALAGFKKALPIKEYKEVKDFFTKLCDMTVLSTLIRIIKYYPNDREKLFIHVFKPPVSDLTEARLEELKEAKDKEDFCRTLSKTPYKRLCDYIKKEDNLFTSRYIYSFCKKHYSMSTNSTLVALCYDMLLGYEEKNLTVLAEGASTDLSPKERLDLLIW